MSQGRKPKDEEGFTSEEIFGDLVDAPAPAKPEPETAPAQAAGVIKVKLAERRPSEPGRPDPLPEELAALIDAFDESREETQRLTPPPEPSSHPPRPATPSDALVPELELPAPVDDAEEGTAYGPYRLIEKIAVGGMAEVFRAKRKGLAGFEKVVAVKRILPHLSHNDEFVQMFVNEAKLVAGLTHPNIVHIFDLGRIGPSYYIAMEYVEGRDLRSTLKRLRERGERLPVGLAAMVASGVAAGLDHAHRSKGPEGQPLRLVHRDVSPQNILLSFDGDVKLTDFGIAKAATKASTTERGALRGKLMYMSPEQAWGRRIDHRSDLFSLGIVLYEMLTGERPFHTGSGSDMGVLDKAREAKIPPPSALGVAVPEALERVLMRALSREPQDRQRNAGVLHRELEGLLKGERSVAPRELGRFLRRLFDVQDDDTQEHAIDPEPAEPAAAEPTAALEPLSVEQLLERFRDE